MVNEWLTGAKSPEMLALQVDEQAGHVDHAGSHQGEDQHHHVHHLTLPRIA
jgi:hypothetical protein